MSDKKKAGAARWQIARRVHTIGGQPVTREMEDAKVALRQMGFTEVSDVNYLWCLAVPPRGWRREENGNVATVYDDRGEVRFTQTKPPAGPEYLDVAAPS